MRALVDGQHDQRDIRENCGSVDAEWDGGYIVAAGLPRQSVSLPRIKQITKKNGECHGGQNSAGHQLLGEAAKRSQAGNQKQIRKAAEKKPEETVEIARDKPSRPGALNGFNRARDEGVLASWSGSSVVQP
jgi:hypothetical protein